MFSPVLILMYVVPQKLITLSMTLQSLKKEEGKMQPPQNEQNMLSF